MFLSSMESILMVKMHSIDYIRIIFNMMKVWYLFYSSLESTELVNQILPQTKQIDNDDNPLIINTENECNLLYQSGWSSIRVNEVLCNSLTDSIIISNNTCLQYIYIEASSLRNINSLVLTSLPNLELFISEDYSLNNVSNLTLSSMI